MERTPYATKYEPKSREKNLYTPKYDTQTNFEKPVQPHLDPVDINEIIPISVPKHYNLLQVLKPMVFSTKGKYSRAYTTIEKDMEYMEVSDREYLEEPDIMDWSYLNIIIRKNLIISLKYFTLKQYIVHDYKYMET